MNFTSCLPRFGLTYAGCHGMPPAYFPLAQLILQMVEHAIAANPFAVRERIFSSPYITFQVKISAPALQSFLDDTKFIGLIDDPDFVLQHLPQPQKLTLNFERLQNMQRKAGKAVKWQNASHPLHFISSYLQSKFKGKPRQYQRALFDIVVQFYLVAQAGRALNNWQKNMYPAAFCSAVRSMMAQFGIDDNTQSIAGLEKYAQQDKVFSPVSRKY